MNSASNVKPGEPFVEDWFEHNIPRWEKWLGEFRNRPNLRALEIGSFEGRSTLWLCQNILTDASCHIDCLDLFAHDPVYGEYHTRFQQNLAPYAHMITEWHGYSFDSLRKVEGPYDIVYIDGWHSAFGALADGVMSWPLLKTGGVMIFDDYLWVPPKYGKPPKPNKLARRWAKMRGRDWRRESWERHTQIAPVESPKLGIDGLLATLKGHYELLGISHQLAVRKTSGFDQGQVGYDT